MELVPNPQTSIYEQVIDDPDLEAALERREGLRVKASKARKALEETTGHVKAIVEGLDLGIDAPVRVGRFVLTQRRTEAAEIAFERAESTRLSIRKLPQ